MKKKNIVAITILIVIALIVWMKYSRDEDPYAHYSMGTLDPNDVG